MGCAEIRFGVSACSAPAGCSGVLKAGFFAYRGYGALCRVVGFLCRKPEYFPSVVA